jgi:hypothetical protein
MKSDIPFSCKVNAAEMPLAPAPIITTVVRRISSASAFAGTVPDSNKKRTITKIEELIDDREKRRGKGLDRRVKTV